MKYMNNEFLYRVCKGDTVLKVSEKLNVPPCALICENNLSKEIREGQMLYVSRPERAVYRVGATDSLASVAQKFGLSESEILSRNKVDYIFFGLNIYV